jgi:aspartate/methionine/tyrosine aminotransferase
VAGLPSYRLAVADWVGPQLGLPLGPENVVAAPGCNGALALVATALFDPGDEVLVITPCWPLIGGILRAQGVVPVEVPMGADGWPEPDAEGLRQRLVAACSERTSGVYFCDPNNPAGFVTPRPHLEVLRDVAVERGLWLVVDVVYKDLILDPTPWSVPTLVAEPDLHQRLVFAGSFSKSHALAGHRAGFIIAPGEIEQVLARVITHCGYHASTSAQEMAMAALGAGQAEIERVRQSYADGLEAACGALRASFRRPQAGAFLFIDFRERVADAAGLLRLLVACMEAGVALAPGEVFGADFECFARLCYTATSADRLVEGIAILNRVLDSWRE